MPYDINICGTGAFLKENRYGGGALVRNVHLYDKPFTHT